MTQEHVAAIVAEFERRWRERTPARDATEVLPQSKVLWSEVDVIARTVTGVQDRDGMALRMELEAPVRKCLQRLKREFPDLQWEPWQKELRPW